MKIVLITGAAGFIGSYAAQHFANSGWRVIGIDMCAPENAPQKFLQNYYQMILPANDFGVLLASVQPQVCVHCAGRASVYHSLQDPEADFKAQVDMTFQVLNQLRLQVPSCKFIFLSSAAVYGNPVTLPISESDQVRPVSPYGFHKLLGEKLCKEFSEIFGVSTAILRIFSGYGIGLRRQVISDICQKALSEPTLVLRGTGLESRDFINVRDIAKAIFLLAEQAPGHAETYNLACGVETTIKELAELILKYSGRQIPLVFDGINPAGNPLNWRADITRIKRLGFTPTITIEKGVKDFVDWCALEMLD
jgi:UDP-glucose 4-epimerase